MIPPTRSNIRSALSCLSPDVPRADWVRMGMAVKHGLDGEGFDLFDEWSQQGSTYDKQDCRAAWKSFRLHGKVTVGTLFGKALDAGWRPHDEAKRETEAERRARVARRRAHEEREAARREADARKAAEQAASLLKSAVADAHPYLACKGFPAAKGPILPDGSLFVPMRDCLSNVLVGAQIISLSENDWQKKFIFGQRSKGAAFRLGTPKAGLSILCEGLATGYSIKAAVDLLRANAAVCVCFSAHNIEEVARAGHGRMAVYADNDASGTGEKCARATGLPWTMPATVGFDANDSHKIDGIMAVCRGLRELMCR